MTDSIKIGNLDINAFKVGAADCSIYLGDVKLYPQSTVSPKLTLYYDGGTVETLNCGDNTYIESGDTSQMTSGYTSAVVGDCVTYIGPKAFANFKTSVSNNSSLTSVTLSEGITQLNGCFTRCTNLSAVTIPNSVTYIGSSTFRNCYKLQSIYIPSGVTAINTQTFYYCSGMTSVNIPSGVTTIGENAFGYCENLLNVVIPDSVTTIKKNAFFNCLSFTSVNIPDSVVSIGDGAFNEGRCTSITIGSGVTSMGLRAFRNQTNLTSITIKATTPPSLGGNDVFDDTNDCPIYVPSESLEAYKAATNWSEYADRFVAIQSNTCSEIIPEPITSYTSTTYDSVYSYTDKKWYMLNNLNQYEEYGIYDIVEDIASATTYEGKLGVVGETEYQYSGNTWVEVGTYEDVSVTYTIDNTSPSPYAGQELSTTFKIPFADIEAIGTVGFTISDNNGGNLQITLDTSGWEEYRYEGSDYYEGTVTNDGEYFYLSLPSEAPQSIAIDAIYYWSQTPIHIIVGSKQATVEYVEKAVPSSALTYSTVADMESVGCPDVGVGQYCYTNGQTYRYSSSEEWVVAQDSEIMMLALDGSGNTRILGCGYNSGDIPEKIAYDFTAVEVYFGQCVTSIGDNAFDSMYSNLDSLSVTSVVPPIIGSNSFTTNYSKLKIYVPCNLVHTYRTSKNWNFYANIIDSNEPNCQIESFKARFYDANNNLIGELQRTYDANGTNITSAETQSYASSAYMVELGDAFVRIQNGAFKGFTHINSLSLGNNVVFVAGKFVSGCTALQTLKLPSDYNSYLNEDLICNCNSLKEITIPSGTTGIYRKSIHDCNSLESITILKPNSVLSFWGSSGTVFQNTNNCKIYVPSNLVNSYKSASGWSTVSSRIQAIPT